MAETMATLSAKLTADLADLESKLDQASARGVLVRKQTEGEEGKKQAAVDKSTERGKKAGQAALDIAKKGLAMSGVAEAINDSMERFAAMAADTLILYAYEAIKNFVDGWDWEPVRKWFESAWKALGEFVGAVTKGVDAVGDWLGRMIDAGKLADKVGAWWGSAMGSMKTALTRLYVLIDSAGEAAGDMVGWLASGLGRLWEWIDSMRGLSFDPFQRAVWKLGVMWTKAMDRANDYVTTAIDGVQRSAASITAGFMAIKSVAEQAFPDDALATIRRVRQGIETEAATMKAILEATLSAIPGYLERLKAKGDVGKQVWDSTVKGAYATWEVAKSVPHSINEFIFVPLIANLPTTWGGQPGEDVTPTGPPM